MKRNMALPLAVAALVAVAALSGAAADCSAQTDCDSCVAENFCGWCSPSPVTFANGTAWTRCADERVSGWTCSHLYQTTKCVAGYVCDKAAGQCKLAPKGQGDTLKNCQNHCTKNDYFKCDYSNPKAPTCAKCTNATDPTCAVGNCTEHSCAPTQELFKCDPKTLTCQSCGAESHCTSDKDCPNSYCQKSGAGPWTCHGSTCQQEYKCKDECGLNPDLVGIWRGVQIQSNYTSGETDFDIGADGSLQVRDASGTITKGKVTALGKDIKFTMEDGNVYSGLYEPWEPSPETEAFAFAFGAANGEKPASVAKAMNGQTFQVFVMSKCKDKATKCDFSGAMRETLAVSMIAESSSNNDTDPCNQFATCSDCLNAPSGLCGWCDTPVVYSSGAPGAQCAGFLPDGKANPPWTCHVRYRRESCFDYKCDWTDFKNPQCKQLPEGESGLSKQACKDGCKPQEGVYRCNNQTFQCEACDVKYCETNADCPGSYCQIDKSKPGPYICHGGMPDKCLDLGHCNATCGSPLLGIWRGIEISNNFQRGEWDFTADSSGSVKWKGPDGTVYEGELHAGDQSAVKEGIAITITVGGSSADNVIATGYAVTAGDDIEYKGLYELDLKGNDNIITMVFLTFSQSSQPTDFDDGMGDSEFVLFQCAPQGTCDFSKSVVG